MKENKTQVIRVEGMHNSYGIGTPVTEDGRVVLFRSGDYHLTEEQLKKRLEGNPRG